MSLIGGGDGGVELRKSRAKGGVGGSRRSGSHGHQQREEPATVTSRVDVQLQLDGMHLGPLLIGGQDAGLCAGDGDRAAQIRIVAVEDVITACRDPLRTRNALVALGPHPAQLRGKAEGELGGAQAVELKEHDRSSSLWSLIGRKHDLTHGKADMRVREDGSVGPDLDFGSLAVDVNGDSVAFNFRLDGEVRKQLDGEEPSLERAVLLAEEDTALAGHGERLLDLGMRPDDRTRSRK